MNIFNKSNKATSLTCITIKHKVLNLEQLGVQEMNAVELKETDGGIIPLLIIGGMLLLSGCAVYKEIPHESNSPEQDTIN